VSGTPSTRGTGATAAPSWLGRRVLPRAGGRYARARQTPPELRVRQIITVDELPPPVDDRFHGSVDAVPPDVLARSTWSAACPVAAADLRYLRVSFWGFDARTHTGELLVHRRVAADVVTAFHRLFDARFPIERMRITTVAERDAEPTGDGNTTGAFVCRPAVGSTRWSEHASGTALDINPFQNPYVKGDLVLPELASAYTRRDRVRPGMIRAGGPVVAAFRALGWTWGGDYRSCRDYMHFSPSGR